MLRVKSCCGYGCLAIRQYLITFDQNVGFFEFVCVCGGGGGGGGICDFYLFIILVAKPVSYFGSII